MGIKCIDKHGVLKLTTHKELELFMFLSNTSPLNILSAVGTVSELYLVAITWMIHNSFFVMRFARAVKRVTVL